MTAAQPSDDHVDTVVAQWGRERPGLDVSGMDLISRVTRLSHLLRTRLNAVFAEHDLESWEFDVLATLLRNGPPYKLTPGQLIDSMMLTSGAMTNRLQRLERRGLITRTKSPDDGRSVVVSLTESGSKVVDAALTDHAANESALVAGLAPDQQAQLIDLLRTFTRSLTLNPPAG